MAEIEILPDARNDLKEILFYLAMHAGSKSADKYDIDFDKLLSLLSRHPESMPLRPKLGQNIRVGFRDPYVIIHRYDASTNTVTILRIIHSKRKITPKLIRS